MDKNEKAEPSANVKPKFNPHVLMPFDKILVRANEHSYWNIDFFSHFRTMDGDEMAIGIGYLTWYMAVPYNEYTKHLIGTTDEAPEYYKYWD